MVLDHRILALPGDRFIFRQLSPAITLGGGTVLDIEPLKTPKVSARNRLDWLKSLQPLDLREWLCSYVKRSSVYGMTELQMLSQITLGKPEARELVGSLIKEGRVKVVSDEPLLVMEPDSFTRLTEQALGYLDAFHTNNPLSTGISREQLNSDLGKTCHPLALNAALSQLADAKKILLQNDLVRLSGRTVVLKGIESTAKAQIEEAFLRAGWKVPALQEVLASVARPPDQARQLVCLLA
jgi:selenocysteine-specific elongation factor